ncbi:MAG: glycosyltransferase, partial [Chloroflexi bacterium]|nr:glycosyltransferase [Chloroflexota bacterium]
SKGPLVSIVTPSYNQARFIEQTIRSVLDQDYPSIEYLIFDGGSTDGSVEVIRSYAPRLAHWASEPDRGQSHAINKGFARASGDLLAWLNSDDYYLPGAVRTAVAALEARPEVDVVFSDAVLHAHESGERWPYTARPADLVALLRDGNHIPQATSFIRRRALERVGLLDESLHAAMDYDLWLRIALEGQLGYVPGVVLAVQRLHGAAKSLAQAASFGPEFVRVLDSFYSHQGVPPRALAVRRRAYARVYYACARSAFWHQQAYGQALRWLVRSAWMHPAPLAQLPGVVARSVQRRARQLL